MTRTARAFSSFRVPGPVAVVALVALVALCTSGCSLAPDYERPAMPVADSWNGQESEPVSGGTPVSGSEASAAPTMAAVADVPWQDFVSDPRLRSVIDLALDNNRDLRIAALHVERARAAYRIQRSDLYPKVGASAGAQSFSFATDFGGDSSSGGSSTSTFEQFSVDLGIASWELDFFGRIRSLKAAALEQYFATQEAQVATQVALVSEVASAYLALAADTESLQLAQDTLKAQQESYDLIQKSTDLGMASDLDLRQAQSQVDGSRADVARIRGLIARDRNALALLAGAPVAPDLLPDGLGAVTEMRDLAPGLPSEVLLDRPDVLVAEHRLKAANADIGAARAAFFPRIALTGSGGTLSSSLSGLFKTGTGVWSFVASIDQPIFQAGALRAGVDVSTVERDLAVAQYEKAIQTAFTEVNDALAQRETLADQQAAQKSLVAGLNEAYRLSKARYDAGVDGYLNVLVAERSLYAARQGLVGVRLADQLNLVTLFKVLGGGGPVAAAGAGGSKQSAESTGSSGMTGGTAGSAGLGEEETGYSGAANGSSTRKGSRK